MFFSPIFVPAGGVGGAAGVAFNASSGQLAFQAGGHGLLGGGIFASAEGQAAMGFNKGPLTTGQSYYGTAEAGFGAGKSYGAQYQFSEDGGQFSMGVHGGGGVGLYGAAGAGKQWTWTTPPLWGGEDVCK